jgi:dihydrofolate reductase
MRMAASRSPSSTGKVLWHLMMSLDGFVAGPNHSMDWMAGLSVPGIVEEVVATTGAILAGRRGYDAGFDQPGKVASKPYGGAWNGPIFVLTHHPDDAPDHSVTFLNCDIAEPVETGLAAAGGKNLEVHGSDIARQCATRGLIDEFHVHIAPVMLGDGIRLFECSGIQPVRWERLDYDCSAQVIDLRYRPSRR